MKKDNRKDRHQKGGQFQQLSRAMSWLLRHGAVQQGLKIQSDGFLPVDDLMHYLKTKKGYKNVNLQIIKEVVQTNDKKRYELQEKGHIMYIRATQGHSMKIINTQQLLKKIQDPTQFPVVIHGTYMKFWPAIKKQGLKRMSRNHIHFAPGFPKQKGVISGMRGSCDIYIEIDMFGAIKDGIQFFISSNNVILTEGVDGVLSPKYFKRVVSKNGDIIQQMQE